MQAPSRTLKTAFLFAVLVAIAVLAATFGRDPDLSHVKVAFLSGSEEGNYHAIVAKVAAEARHQHGRVDNLPSAGSVENIARLVAAKASCNIQLALVQEGLPWPESHPFQLIGRLPIPESFVVLGRDADRVRSVADLRGMRVGIGPVGSGSEHVARQVMAQLAELDIKLTTQPLNQQLAMLERGELDLGAMVIDADARLMIQAVRDRKLQIVDISGRRRARAPASVRARPESSRRAITTPSASCRRRTNGSFRSTPLSSATAARASPSRKA